MELCARLSLLRVLFGATDRRAISFAGSGAAWRGGGVRVDRWSLVWPCQFATVSCRADADRRQCLARDHALRLRPRPRFVGMEFRRPIKILDAGVCVNSFLEW